jgi:3-hydroxyacyl-[acyl-carrier-protein] dehydratase
MDPKASLQKSEIGVLGFAAPLRAIDHLVVREHEGKLTLQATKTITADDPYMAAHFPNCTIFPGVFILEGLRQGVICALGECGERLPEIRTVRSLRFSAPLLPGDRMIMDATIEPGSREHSFEVVASCRRDDGATTAHLKVEFDYGINSFA